MEKQYIYSAPDLILERRNMFYPIDKFPFLEQIRRNVDAIAMEFEAQMKTPLLHNFMHSEEPEIHAHSDYWIKEGGFSSGQIGYDARDGSWGSFPLYKKGFPIKWYDVEKTFPKTFANVMTVPNVNFSAFFKIAPGAGTKEHKHAQQNLIFHLCLFDIEGHSVLTCNGEEKVLSKKGDCAVFDYSKAHSSFNFAKQTRINLIIDFTADL
jgi:aspartyl/asparaginyl beta-hydroxylase (cupin superfamily)